MLKKSPFFDFLNRRDGSYEDFVAASVEDRDYINWNGYSLPYDYGDAEAEYQAIRNSCAICDVSPMRKIRVHGDGASAFFDRLLTRSVSNLAPMRAAYTVFCNADGSLKDDAIVYKFAEDDYMFLPSDVDHSPYFNSLCADYGIQNVTFTECTESWVGVAIQGPMSATVMQHLGFDSIATLAPFEARELHFAGGAVCVARMGFTADLGYECWMAPSHIRNLCKSIEAAREALDIALPGYGLNALQTCRLEGGFIVAGWDCSTEVDPQSGFERSPLELGLEWLVDLDSGDFVGKDALVEQAENGAKHVLRYFSAGAKIELDDGAEIYAAESDDVIGRVTNSAWSWGLDKTIGNASVLVAHCETENARVSVGGEFVGIAFSRKPLIDLPRRNEVPAPIA